MKIKRKTKKLIKELKKMESGIFKFSDGKAIYYSLDEYLDSLGNKILRLRKIIDELEEYIQLKIIRSENESDYIIDEHDIKEIYYKLQELKEEDK